MPKSDKDGKAFVYELSVDELRNPNPDRAGQRQPIQTQIIEQT